MRRLSGASRAAGAGTDAPAGPFGPPGLQAGIPTGIPVPVVSALARRGGALLFGAACLALIGCARPETAPRHFPVPGTEEGTGPGVILHETMTVSRRPARMVRVMSVPRPGLRPDSRPDARPDSEFRPDSASDSGPERASLPAASDAAGSAPVSGGESELGAKAEEGGAEHVAGNPEGAFPADREPPARERRGPGAGTARTPGEGRLALEPLPVENLLDEMDVYALSPHAAQLALPRMVPPEYVRQVRQGVIRLPAPEIWQGIILRASERYGLDPKLVEAVIRVESNFDAVAESPRGAQGLMQLMPETQVWLGVTDPFDPEANVTAGSDYLRRQLDRFGSLELALAAYNAGPGNVERYGGIPPFPETQAYVARVLELYRR